MTGGNAMGTYLNPGNSGFSGIRNGTYIDKSGLIRLINRKINTPGRLTCISRPRRFGKSYTTQMLCAYYDRSCDSSMLFADLEIARDPDYDAYRNQYNVIYLDMTNIMGDNREDGKQKPFISFIIRRVTEELLEEYPEMELKWDKTDTAAIAQIKERSYPAVLQNFGGEILLVGINYNAKTKVHQCQIEQLEQE